MERELMEGPITGQVGIASRGGTAVVASLLGLTGSAWLITAQLGMPDMRLGVLTRAPTGSMASRMGMSGSMSTGVSVFLASWTVMMVAMMVPSTLPLVRTFDRRVRMTGRSGGATALFLTGYLLLWSAAGMLAYLAVQALQARFPDGSETAVRMGSILLVVAGLYQLTPLKQACLSRCRSPRSIAVLPSGSRIPDYAQGLRAGMWSGVHCLGSSWALMLVLLLVGMMNLVWMGVIAGVILVEKAMPGGLVTARAVGCALAGWGIILLIAPHTVPTFGGG